MPRPVLTGSHVCPARARSDDVSSGVIDTFRIKVCAGTNWGVWWPCVSVFPRRGVRPRVRRHGARPRRTQVIAAKEAGSKPPIVMLDGSSFLFTRHKNVYFVAVTRSNANAGACACATVGGVPCAPRRRRTCS